ncbi:MAG: phosphoglucosamine mutase [Actinobacteria bacterium]|nr:phosphoglucosamine mutase [Actinomycetota bacterium]
MGRLFGTDGVRGIANSELTPEMAFKLGEAAGHFLGQKSRGRIVVGMDTRLSGDMLEASLVAGVCSTGVTALRAGVVPTPAVAFLTKDVRADGGVVISASHNPAEYNGIKFFDRDGFKLPDEIEAEIEEFLVAERDWERPVGAGVGRAECLADGADRYIAHAVSTVPGRLDGLRIAMDCGHGAAAVTSPAAFAALGAEVTAINCDWDGTDINRGCGSTHMDVIASMVRDGQYDLGISHDGDADRVLAVDEHGSVIDGDAIMTICAIDLLERRALPGKTVVTTVMSNLGFEKVLHERGISVVKTRVGDRYVLDQMRTSGAVFGGEQSGHVIFLEHASTGDGLITALQLAAVIRRSGKRLSELAGVMTHYPQVLLNVPVNHRELFSASSVIAQAVREAEAELAEDGRVLVRTSGTEPLVRVMVEAAEEARAREIAERIAGVVRGELG